MKRNTSTPRKLGLSLMLALALATLRAAAADGVATGDTSGNRIAFSNSHAGNSFREVMIRNFEETGAKAVKDHKIKGYAAVSANASVTEQASQMQNLILQGYEAIILLAGSDTAR